MVSVTGTLATADPFSLAVFIPSLIRDLFTHGLAPSCIRTQSHDLGISTRF
ncbi:MAG: hypothetical protein CM1200mP15_01330 [Dehalococcoidia bacterium]|nr:MAG: hypothetical protein CM1200mP15_01330 [Dehalococcoidia bacterium]